MKTKTNTVTTKAKPATTEPAPLTGAALGAELNGQGFSLLQQGSYADAIGVLRRAVDAFPDGSTDIDYAYALYNLAHALRLAGHPEDAIPLLRQRLQLTNNQRGVVSKELALAQQEAGVSSSGGTGAPAPGADGDDDEQSNSSAQGPPAQQPGSGGVGPG